MSLPAERRAINGRTFSQVWEPASMNPVTLYRAPRLSHVAVGWICLFGSAVLVALIIGG